MGSDAALRMPVVHLTDGVLVSGSDARSAAGAQIRAALERFGCFEVVHDDIGSELRDAVFGAAKELFALPLEAKLRNASDGVHRAYIGQVPGLPYESLAIKGVQDPAAAERFTSLMWPEGNRSFRDAAFNFAKKAAGLEMLVTRMLLESLGVDKHYDSLVESTDYMLRFSESAPAAAAEGEDHGSKLAVPSHVDGNITTIIFQGQVQGLELQTRSGDWIPFAPSSPNAAVFMIGNAFRAWSNDRLFAAPHRVRVIAGATRHSVLLFSVPADETVIEAPAELAGDGFPRRFKPYRYADYWEFFKAAGNVSERGGDVTSILPDFCGIPGAGEGEGQPPADEGPVSAHGQRIM